jgi:hypothetical protein
MLPHNRDGAGHAAFHHKILRACNAHVGDVSLVPEHFEKNVVQMIGATKIKAPN